MPRLLKDKHLQIACGQRNGPESRVAVLMPELVQIGPGFDSGSARSQSKAAKGVRRNKQGKKPLPKDTQGLGV